MNTNQVKLTFLLLISLVPIVAATLYFRASLESGMATSSQGTLIQPVLNLPQRALHREDGEPAYLSFEEMTAGVSPADYTPRPWQLLFLTPAECGQVCLDRVYLLRQIHLRLARTADRVQRAVVVVDAAGTSLPQSTLATLREQQPDLQILQADPVTVLPHLRPSANGRDPVGENFIYVADPVGNIMLYFTPENSAEDIYKDVGKLLDQTSLG